jgi:GLPGLI family protein
VKSQNSNTGVIHYNHIDNHYGVSYNSYLVFNQNKSYFVTAKDSLGLSGEKANDKDVVVEAVYFDDVKKTRKKGLQVYSDKSIDSVYFTNAFSLTSKMMYAKEKRPKIKWEFENETKKIGKFNCKKAIANFRGRKYICWYTGEIPLPYGPWKLQGLPGIILEAKSEDGFFNIAFKKIKYPVQNIKVPSSKNSLLKNGKQFISFKDYILKQKEEIKRVNNYMKISAKKYNVQIDPFSERDNFLEVFGF